MGPNSIFVAYLAIGISAALVAGVLPFFRGVRGLGLNLVAGVSGAVAGGYFGRLVLAHASFAPLGFLFAVAGALGFIAAAHALWSANESRHRREV